MQNYLSVATHNNGRSYLFMSGSKLIHASKESPEDIFSRHHDFWWVDMTSRCYRYVMILFHLLAHQHFLFLQLIQTSCRGKTIQNVCFNKSSNSASNELCAWFVLCCVLLWFGTDRLHTQPSRLHSGRWASYQIRKTAGCACIGNAGNVFPATD